MGEEFSTEGAPAALERSQFMPALSIELAVERYNAVTEFVSRVLRKDVDYGVIPGTEKRTLLKPGAEKLTTFFGLSTRFQLDRAHRGLVGRGARRRAFLLLPLPLPAPPRPRPDGRGRRLLQLARAEVPLARGAARVPRVRAGGHHQGARGVRRRLGSVSGRRAAAARSSATATSASGRSRRAASSTRRSPTRSTRFRRWRKSAASSPPSCSPSTPPSSSRRTWRTCPSRRPPSSRARALPVKDAGAVEDEIRAACRELGKTEEQLAAWVRKKYGADGVAQLTAEDKRDVLAFLRGMLTKREAA